MKASIHGHRGAIVLYLVTGVSNTDEEDVNILSLLPFALETKQKQGNAIQSDVLVILPCDCINFFIIIQQVK